MERRIPILHIDSLRESCPNVCHLICCNVIIPEDMEGLEGMEHQGLDFVVQAAAFDCSSRIPVDQLEDDMPGVSEYQHLSKLLRAKNAKTLKKCHPFSFIISSDAYTPSEGLFNMSSGIHQDPPRSCRP